MESIGELVKNLVHRFESQRSLHRQHAEEAWEEVVPDPYREHTTVRSYRNGTLTVGVSSQPLLSELSNFHREQLKTELSKELESLDELKFTAI